MCFHHYICQPPCMQRREKCLKASTSPAHHQLSFRPPTTHPKLPTPTPNPPPAQHPTSRLPSPLHLHLNHLVQPLIPRHINPIPPRHLLPQKPPPHEMPPPIPPHQRLRRRQTNQRLGHIPLPWALPRRPLIHPPTTRRIDRQNRNLRIPQRLDHAGERLADFALEREPEDGVDHVVGLRERGVEVGDEGDGQGFQLGAETGVEVRGGLLRVVDGGFVAVVVEVAGGD